MFTSRKNVAAVVDRAQEHDFWSDAFFESNLQLALAKRTLEGGRWRSDVNDPNMRDGEPEGVAHWLAVQDIRAAVHLTNSLQPIRRRRFDISERGIEVVHGAKVDLNDRSKSAIALGLGFNKLTHRLIERFDDRLFRIAWEDVERAGFKGRTDDPQAKKSMTTSANRRRTPTNRGYL
jgi:hypothetical protein